MLKTTNGNAEISPGKSRLACRGMLLLIAGTLCGNLHAMEINILSAGAVEAGMEKFAHHVKLETGHELKIQFNTAPQIAKRLADGEVFDILVSPPAVMERVALEGKIASETRVAVGRVGVGVTVRDDLVAPDISSPEKLRQAVLAADTVIYNQASTGLYMDKLFEKMEIAQQLKSRTKRYANGEMVLEHIIKGRGAEIGFGAMTEIRRYEGKGLKMVGQLPASLQNWTQYEAVRMKSGAPVEAVEAVLKQIVTPGGKAAFASAGIE